MYYKRKTSLQQKPKVSQDQVAWLMMELESMRKYNETIQDNNRGQKKSS